MITLQLEEADRQLVLLALAVLSLESPGFDYALNEVAKKIDNVESDRAVMYDQFRVCRRDGPPRGPWCNHPLHKVDEGLDLKDDE